MSDTVNDRVARGAAWLDEVDPEWRDGVDTETLVMSDGCNCVLGQLFAADDVWGVGYRYTYAWGRGDWANSHGFTVLMHRGNSWPELREAWIAEINREVQP